MKTWPPCDYVEGAAPSAPFGGDGAPPSKGVATTFLGLLKRRAAKRRACGGRRESAFPAPPPVFRTRG
jgi:hypothetical protein